ncbi:AAA family ATPase [Methylophaga sp. OBS4]|uniref:AAA family ATPase n=1 Tax=Methylophaga sp. OBS4 TaxID=2991935 RepID=UPI00225773C8|nr:AAA family ATPase [Methylophaga sp. OBS4]MCX4186752.1 ATP-binding protein [Methylophaga sp. OBS4]
MVASDHNVPPFRPQGVRLKKAKFFKRSELVVLRGLPGSGKSTKAAKDFPEHLHYEPDHLFCDTRGRYRFDMQVFEQAKGWVLMMADFALSRGEDVVVSDVFAKLDELEPYIDVARYHGADVRVIDCVGDYGNQHKVPLTVLSVMAEAFEPIPTEGRVLTFTPVYDGDGIDEYIQQENA